MIDKKLLKPAEKIKSYSGLDDLLKKSGICFAKRHTNYFDDSQDDGNNRPLTPYHSYKSVDELSAIDEQREKDNFPKKIKIKRVTWTTREGKKKVVFLPSVTEDKFMHDDETRFPSEGSPTSGTGSGEVGEVIRESPAEDDGDEEGESGAGSGGNGEYDIDSESYELGKFLVDRIKLPNMEEKAKKKVFKQYVYDLTDKQLGHGQVLDKKATLKRIIGTNLALGNIHDRNNIDPTKLLIAPKDRVYKLLSREKEFESPALVFLVRDCSGSMNGKPADIIVMQHLFVYSWLFYQYDKLVEKKFIVHDTAAKEVPDFNAYYNTRTGGGTLICTGFEKVNEIVKEGCLEKDYNIYVFYGSDGEDFENTGKRTLEEIYKALSYTRRIGITIASRYAHETDLEKYMKGSTLLERYPNLIRLDAGILDEWDEERAIKGIERLMSEN